ncbi:MAG: PQQ-binding-like beta-propeller repeat protein [Candidatus Acidiferrales bacterium]
MTTRIFRSMKLHRQAVFAFFFLILGIAVAFTVDAAQRSANDWPEFGSDVQSTSAPSFNTGITAANVASMTRHEVTLDGIVDASAIYLHGVTVKGATHDVFFVTTTYGKTIAIDADQGKVLWEYTPQKFDSWNNTRQITNSTPVADPDRQYIYAAAPDGTVQKLAVSDGHALWTTPVTLLPSREKMDSPLKIFRGHIIAVTGGYIGDRPPYQGHVAILDAQSGKLLHVWNSLCSDRSGLIEPSSCSGQRSAIWGRSGATIDPNTGNIFIATGNGTYDGKTNWGDATIELNPDATQMLGNFTPENNAELDQRDLDVGSTSPIIIGDQVLAQGGKDDLIRILSVKQMAGTSPHAGGELQSVPTPSGAKMFTAGAVWKHNGQTWLIVADGGGTEAWNFPGGKLVQVWKNSNGGTSPVVANGLVYVYDPQGGLRIYDGEKGTQIAHLECGSGHWNSPIVVDGKIGLPEGNANRPSPTGVFDIWTLSLGR